MATTTAYYVTGATVRAVIRNAALQFADVVHEAMDTYNASDIDDYDTACTEIGNTGEYHVTWPTSWLAVGAYNIQYVPLAGGSIVESDMLNRFSASNYYWDGTNLVPDWAVKLAISASPITDSIEELTNAIEAIVTHTDYGNAKLVRSTTPANTLTVDANHEVTVPDTQKVDVETIKTQAVTCGAGVTVGVYVGSTAAASTHTAANVYTAFGTGGNLTTCATATSVTVSDKTGFKLASDGLGLVVAWTVDVTGTVSGNAVAGSAMTLTAGERDSIATALLDLASAVDTKTVREALRYMAATVGGKVSGAGTGTNVFKGLDGSTDRVTATVDVDGNRTAVSYD